MFNTHFPFTKKYTTTTESCGEKIIKHCYHFTSTKSGITYEAIFEEYQHCFFAIKFYDTKHTKLHDKFSKRTSKFELQPIIGTILEIIKLTVTQKPTASFGFVGVASKRESKVATQRYRIYKRVFIIAFSPQTFEHYDYGHRSMYMVLNKKKIATDAHLLIRIQMTMQALYRNVF